MTFRKKKTKKTKEHFIHLCILHNLAVENDDNDMSLFNCIVLVIE